MSPTMTYSQFALGIDYTYEYGKPDKVSQSRAWCVVPLDQNHLPTRIQPKTIWITERFNARTSNTLAEARRSVPEGIVRRRRKTYSKWSTVRSYNVPA